MPYIGMQLIGDADLEHHGIKGMHWGIRRTAEELGRRRAARQERRAKFEKYQQGETYRMDKNIFGKRGAKRIYKNIHQKGKTRKQAEKREWVRMLARVGKDIAVGIFTRSLAFGILTGESTFATRTTAKGAKVVYDWIKKASENAAARKAGEALLKIPAKTINAVVLNSNEFSFT